MLALPPIRDVEVPHSSLLCTRWLCNSPEAGVEPELHRWPALARTLLFGPLSPISFRLSGPDSLPEAPRRVEEDARAFGAVPTLELTSEQRLQLQALASARKDASFTQFVEQVTFARPGRDTTSNEMRMRP